MKKIHVSITALVMFCAISLSSGHAFDLSAGVKGGINVANFIGRDRINSLNEYALGFVGGPHMEIGFVDAFSFQPELLFSMKGTKVLNVRDNLYYLEIPLLFKLRALHGKAVSPNIFLGPVPGFAVFRNTYSVDKVIPFDFGMTLGGGFVFGQGFFRVVTDIRYTLGLVEFSDRHLRNGTFSAMIGFALTLEKTKTQ